MAKESTQGLFIDDSAYNFSSDTTIDLNVAHGGVTSMNNSIQIYWDTVGGGLDGKIEIYTSNRQDGTYWTQVYESASVPLEIDLDVNTNTYTVVLQYPHEMVRLKYIHGSNTGTGQFYADYNEVVV